MSTPYEEVYDFFLMKVKDYSFLQMSEESLYYDLEKFMRLSLTKFRICKNDLSDRDDELNKFNVDLSDSEKDIISSLMVIEYLKPEITTSNLIRQAMSDKDFKIYSQANHLDQLLKLYNHVKNEAQKMLNNYSYYTSSLDDLN